MDRYVPTFDHSDEQLRDFMVERVIMGRPYVFFEHLELAWEAQAHGYYDADFKLTTKGINFIKENDNGTE